MKHKAVRKNVRRFAETELGPIAYEIDRDSQFPWEVVEKMRSLGYFGLQVPKEYGGAELDSISSAIVIEELSRVCAAIGLCISVHNSVGAYPIVRFGTAEQKKRFLPPLASGEHIGAFCLTEANAGSDASAVETTAIRQNGEYVINGTKVFVTNGGVCGLALIFARTVSDGKRAVPSLLIVEKGTPGFSVGELEDLCGMRANPVSSLFLENVRVPTSHMLGQPGDGMKIGLNALDTGRIGIGAQALGICQSALEAAVTYAKERQQFKKPIASFQTIQNYLADMATETDAARLLLYRAGALRDEGQSFGTEAAMAKLYCSTVASRVTNLALQIHGGYGYSKEYDVERYFRDAKITEIYEGTSEVQRLVIARGILSQLR
jgi:alkylation response protein AidB-like acyl-CoA dehydrogenase